jgi:hypothetical protein
LENPKIFFPSDIAWRLHDYFFLSLLNS